MLSKMNASVPLAQCWYLRKHVPAGRRHREDDGVLHCTCRYCQRPIKSRGGKIWDLAEGFDLDALAEAGRNRHFSVVDVIDDMVIARYPIDREAGDEDVAELLANICEKHGVEDAAGAIEVRLVQGQGGTRRLH
ncbi:hypothetical protein [Novosphingobium sp. PY1]|uniref:hypothetical protein n=1 Tax=Novosphingobium sp. PY1 TaxID=1882221 RepID=UPI001A8ED79E|nr:hypothetical protein [Novosphingobium sp. PY1]GFM30232.1 putative uncharacterized protein [Novosphingobium sp. PY1]